MDLFPPKFIHNFIQKFQNLIFVKNERISQSDRYVVQKYITYENGEYAYIFIEGKGFVGVNLGNDKNNTIDDLMIEMNLMLNIIKIINLICIYLWVTEVKNF